MSKLSVKGWSTEDRIRLFTESWNAQRCDDSTHKLTEHDVIGALNAPRVGIVAGRSMHGQYNGTTWDMICWQLDTPVLAQEVYERVRKELGK